MDFFAATGAVLEDLRTVLTGLRADLTVRLTVLRAAGAAAVLVLERTRFVVRFLVVAAGVVFFALYAVAFLAFTPGAAAGAGFAVFGDTAAAENAYRQIMRIDPGNVLARVQLAKRLASRGSTGEAIALLEDALRLDAGNTEARRVLNGLRGDP